MLFISHYVKLSVEVVMKNKDIIYPAVLYRDNETGWYTIAVYELGIVTEGETVEKAFLNCKEYLQTFCECAVRFDCDIEPPLTFEQTSEKYKNNVVILVDTCIE